MNLKQQHKKKKKKNPSFCKGVIPGTQSVSLSVETTVQYMNNTLCENSLFSSAHTLCQKQVNLQVYIFRLCASITEKSNSTDSTSHFR